MDAQESDLRYQNRFVEEAEAKVPDQIARSINHTPRGDSSSVLVVICIDGTPETVVRVVTLHTPPPSVSTVDDSMTTSLPV